MGEKNGKWFRALNTYKYVALVLLAGLLLLLWPGQGGERTEEVPVASQTMDSGGGDLQKLCREMENILSEIEGAGRLRLMLTLEDEGEKKLAGDSSLRYSGQTASPDDYERTAETVVLSRSGGGEEPVVICQQAPRFRGALVVCEGGDVPAVRLAVIQSVSALTGLGADKISVVKSNGVEVSGG